MDVDEFLKSDFTKTLSDYACRHKVRSLKKGTPVGDLNGGYGIKECRKHKDTHIFKVEDPTKIFLNLAHETLQELSDTHSSGIITDEEHKKLKASVHERFTEVNEFFRPMRNRFRTLRENQRYNDNLKRRPEVAERKERNSLFLASLIQENRITLAHLLEFYVCGRKKLFIHEVDAQKMAHSTPASHLTVYLCVYCTGYHLGHGNGKTSDYEKTRNARSKFLANQNNKSIEFVKTLGFVQL